MYFFQTPMSLGMWLYRSLGMPHTKPARHKQSFSSMPN